MPTSVSLDYILFISATKSSYIYFLIHRLLSSNTEIFNYNKFMKELERLGIQSLQYDNAFSFQYTH